MASKDRNKDFLFSDDGGFISGKDGESHKYEDGSGYYHGTDGSQGYIYSDGSGYYHGADGSDGHIYSDGSGYYHGADGSNGYRYSDGSGYFNDADGSRFTKDFDGSGYYKDEYGNSIRINTDGEYESKSLGANIGDAIGSIASAVIVSGLSELHRQYQVDKEIEHERQLEILKIEAEKEKERIKISEARRIERKEWRHKHKKGIGIVIAILLVSIIFFVGILEYQKLIPLGYSEQALIGMHYAEVIQKLEKKGFTNIYATEISDLSLTNEKNEYLVTDIKLRFLEQFDINTHYPYDMKVEIIYHTLKLYNAPITSKKAKGLNYVDVIKQYEDAGFINVKTVVEYDIITGWITDDGAVESITIDGKNNFDTYDKFRPDAEVVITYHTLKKNKPK